jgi:flagellar motor switch protein FliN
MEQTNEQIPEVNEPVAPRVEEPSILGAEKDKKLEMLLDLNLPVSIELGRTSLPLQEILAFQRGSVVEFEKLASEPVDVLINGKKMAEGEVVVIEKHFGIRITNLVDASERLKGLGK